MQKEIVFMTSNLNKVREIKEILSSHSIFIKHMNFKVPEIQSDSLEKIAKTSSIEAMNRSGKPTIVEDSGLFIQCLNGFPGPYSSYIQKTIGNSGILKLMKSFENRGATFMSVIAYCDQSQSPLAFVGKVHGSISKEERGKVWGFDPIFMPRGTEKTYAEMLPENKNKLSHRKEALEKFILWYNEN